MATKWIANDWVLLIKILSTWISLGYVTLNKYPAFRYFPSVFQILLTTSQILKISHSYLIAVVANLLWLQIWMWLEQGKSEGFESCDWPVVRKRPIWVKIGDALYRVTLKFDGWPWKTIGHLSFAVSSFVQHFIAIGEFKLELQSGNAHFGSNSTIFRAVWPWNLTDDLEKQQGTSTMLLLALCIIS